ncbi:MAG: exodeoxyribonuclease VII large subunit [Ruminococcus sp.]|nr:exodeoxyribonuclease VII large subunit [Ruminococcus sp.]
MAVLTVTQINRYISFKLKEDRNIQSIMVQGEISNFTNHYRTGHLYFTLKDGESSIKAVMFASAASRLKFVPEDGMSVIISGSVSVFERDGVYQLYVNDIQPYGAGAEYIAIEQLKAKLAKEGIFDNAHKRQLPVMPSKIGVVTSKSGAALRDVVNILSRRYPIGELLIVNALVQGSSAADSVCKGIMKAELAGCDVIIVGRGGGSAEDLSAFNSEKVARAVYNSNVPVISAVGHETDYSLTDLAADMRAPTPSAAAELVAPSVDILSSRIDSLMNRAENAALKMIDDYTDRLVSLNSSIMRFSPENRLKLSSEKLDALEKRLQNSASSSFERRKSKLDQLIRTLDSLSPLKVLSRGYSLVYSGQKLINDASMLKNDDEINVRFGNGEASAVVKQISVGR